MEYAESISEGDLAEDDEDITISNDKEGTEFPQKLPNEANPLDDEVLVELSSCNGNGTEDKNGDISSYSKPHMCDICNKRFRFLNSLSQHKKQHDFGISNDEETENKHEKQDDVKLCNNSKDKEGNNSSPSIITKSPVVPTLIKKAKRANLMDKINKLSNAAIQSDDAINGDAEENVASKKDVTISDLLGIQPSKVTDKNVLTSSSKTNEKENDVI